MTTLVLLALVAFLALVTLVPVVAAAVTLRAAQATHRAARVRLIEFPAPSSLRLVRAA